MSESHIEHPVRVFFYALGSVVIFAIMNILAKMAVAECSVAQIIFFRNAFAFIPILWLIKHTGGWNLLKTKNHLGHFWRGIVGIVSMSCFFISFAMLPMANATSIHFASPLILTILAIPLLGEQVGRARWTAVIVGLCGVLFMLKPETGGDAEHLTGSLVALAAAFLAAFAMIFVRKLGRTEHAMTIVFYFSLYGTIMGALAMIFMWNPIGPLTLFLLIMTGLLGGVGQTFLTYAYASAPASYVAPFSYFAMVIAILADILVWGIWPDWRIYVGCPVIIGSGLFIVYRESLKKKSVTVRANVYGLPPASPTERDEKENSI